MHVLLRHPIVIIFLGLAAGTIRLFWENPSGQTLCLLGIYLIFGFGLGYKWRELRQPKIIRGSTSCSYELAKYHAQRLKRLKKK
jgi:hypothetical protein